VAIVILGLLGTYVFMNSLRYQITDNTNSSENINTNIVNNALADSDNDGLIDGREEFYGTDPANPDSDGDGFSDGFEVINGYNPKGEGKLEIYGQNQANTNS